MNDQLQHINDLKPIAQRMRERQEVIIKRKADVYAHIGELVSLASEQGRDCLLAKTKLGKLLRWSDWLNAHVPNITEDEAHKYERITTEQLSDPRQCVFAFLPPHESEPKPARTPPKAWERAWGFVTKLKSIIQPTEIKSWPASQVDLTRHELEPAARALWPEKWS